jgi:hypothetical protein
MAFVSWSEGGIKPLPPNTWRGMMVKPAPAANALFRNVLLEVDFLLFIFSFFRV